MRRFFIEGIKRDDRSVAITGEEFYHLTRVLRLKRNATVTVFDGRGLELTGRVASVEGERAVVEVTGLRESNSESPLEITLLQGMAKGGRMEIIIQKGTELGVSSIRPFSTERSVPKLGVEGIEKRLHRWRRVAVEAAKQCGRGIIPAIEEPVPLEEAIVGHGDCLKLVPWEMEKSSEVRNVVERYQQEVKERQGKVSKVVVLIGPEGGLSRESVEMACREGFQPVTLGPRVLRTETAAIALLAVLQYAMGDLE
ncbi:MAG: 16S rRNA (uracil(1498)-N(3))-methyltransferase [Deltaproteobacteria bacterium]|nr:16S rRNA (uracil(1498)-N(3))-methyltransferase [Deltaproteobacteria bacterium]